MSDEFGFTINGELHGTGCKPRAWTNHEILPCYAPPKAIDRSLWVTQEDVMWAKRQDCYQNGRNSCCLSSFGQALVLHLGIMGRADVMPDHTKIWSILTGGRNTGVSLQEAGAYIKANGFPLVGSSEVIRIAEWADCSTVEEFLDARAHGWLGIYGRFIGRGGHAECAGYLKVSGGKVTVRVPGTWGDSYGEKGCYDVSESDLARGIPYFGALAFREVEVRPADTQGMQDATG